MDKEDWKDIFSGFYSGLEVHHEEFLEVLKTICYHLGDISNELTNIRERLDKYKGA